MYLFRRSLLYYISNNVLLHDRDGDNTNAKSRMEKHRDLVYKTTLMQSSLVRNVVESFNAVQGNSRRARNERRRILSQIVMDFSYKLCCQLELKIPDAGSCVRTHFTHNTHTCINSLTHSLTHSLTQPCLGTKTGRLAETPFMKLVRTQVLSGQATRRFTYHMYNVSKYQLRR